MSGTKCYQRTTKKYVDVPQPVNFQTYKKHMGYVDAMDQRISTYRVRMWQRKLLCNCNCAWSSPKHVLDLSCCTVRFISLVVTAERCQSDACVACFSVNVHFCLDNYVS